MWLSILDNVVAPFDRWYFFMTMGCARITPNNGTLWALLNDNLSRNDKREQILLWAMGNGHASIPHYLKSWQAAMQYMHYEQAVPTKQVITARSGRSNSSKRSQEVPEHIQECFVPSLNDYIQVMMKAGYH